MISSFQIALIDGVWHVTAFVDQNGNKHKPIVEADDQRPFIEGPLSVGGSTWYYNLSRHFLPICECWRCGVTRKQLRGINPNDCGGCETCDQFFGGCYVCTNLECSESKKRSRLDPEGTGYLI